MNTFTQPTKLSNDIESILGISDMLPEEQAMFFDRIGELVVESAVLRFVVTLTEDMRLAFEQWLEARQASEDLLQAACETYPHFGELLTEEMQAFHMETKRLFGVTA